MMQSSDTLTTTDVVVVGGGIVGMCTAFELRQRGFSVALVEQRFPAFAASGRNPGIIWVQTQRTGLELQLARAAHEVYAAYQEQLGDTFDYRCLGGLFFYETDEQQQVLQHYVDDRCAAGVNVEFVSRRQAVKHFPLLPSTALGAVYCADDGQLDTQRFVRALSAAATRTGIEIYENTAVLSTIRRGDTVTGVRTVRGDIAASGVVWATGAWANNLGPEGITVPLQTSRMGQVITQPLTKQAKAVVLHGPRGVAQVGALVDLPQYVAEHFAAPSSVVGGAGVADDWAYDDILALNADGALLIGTSIDATGSLNPHISIRATNAMVSTTLERYGDYGHFGVTGLWAGLHSDSLDHLPVVDRVDGAYVNVGHGAGIATGPVTGRLMAQLIAGESSEFSDGLRADRATLATANTTAAPKKPSRQRPSR
jgi:glycine/D-amino acid oxidase-like deaminating enzyme